MCRIVVKCQSPNEILNHDVLDIRKLKLDWNADENSIFVGYLNQMSLTEKMNDDLSDPEVFYGKAFGVKQIKLAFYYDR